MCRRHDGARRKGAEVSSTQNAQLSPVLVIWMRAYGTPFRCASQVLQSLLVTLHENPVFRNTPESALAMLQGRDKSLPGPVAPVTAHAEGLRKLRCARHLPFVGFSGRKPAAAKASISPAPENLLLRRSHGLNQNVNRDHDPVTSKSLESDPIGLAGTSFSTHTYADGSPILGGEQHLECGIS